MMKNDYRLTLSAFVGDAERKALPLKSYCEKFWSWHNSELIKSSLLYNIVDVDKSHEVMLKLVIFGSQGVTKVSLRLLGS